MSNLHDQHQAFMAANEATIEDHLDSSPYLPLLKAAPALYKAAWAAVQGHPEAKGMLKDAIGLAHGYTIRHDQMRPHELQDFLNDPEDIGSRRQVASFPCPEDPYARYIITPDPDRTDNYEVHYITTDSQGVIDGVTPVASGKTEMQAYITVEKLLQREPRLEHKLTRAIMFQPRTDTDWVVGHSDNLTTLTKTSLDPEGLPEDSEVQTVIHIDPDKGRAGATIVTRIHGAITAIARPSYKTVDELLRQIDSGTKHGTQEQWAQLFDEFETPVNDDDDETLDDSFLHFPKGTPREDVLRWFDEHAPQGLVTLMNLAPPT